MSQLALPLAYRCAAGEADFLVAPANAQAVAWLDRWPAWPMPRTLLAGPPASGRSHLARLFAARAGATLLDDADHAPPEAVFHAWNAAAPARPLLLVAAPGWRPPLPDLASRLAATPAVAIAPPDDALLAALLAKGFAERGLRVTPEVIDYILARAERSFAAVAATVAALDAAALAAGKGITLPLARAVLMAQFGFAFDARSST